MTQPKVLLLILVLAAMPATPAAATPALTVETLADGVYAFRPTGDALDAWRAISNSGAVVLDDGVLIYDSHWTPEVAEEALALLREHTDRPVRYVVSSHFHGDHTGGYWAYGKDVEIITHHATRERLRGDFADLPDELPAQIAQYEAQLEQVTDPAQRARLENALRRNRDLLSRLEGDAPPPFPTLTFDSRVVLHRGRVVEVYFLGRGHTDGDAIVYLPEEKIAFLGDLLFARTLPNVADGYTREWMATLEAVLELGATRFVPGHGPLATAEHVREQIAYLRWLRDAVQPFVDEGKSVEEAKAGVTLPERYADFEFSFFLGRSVEKVYGELQEGR